MQTPTIFTTTLLLLATTATAATLPPRQIGNLACNLARLQIVGALNDAGSAAGSIADTTTQAAVSAGIDQANAGVGAVAQALLSGGAASADGRDEVAAGLTAANEALAGADSTDPAVAETQDAVDNAVAAGQQVLAECK